jgi:hypothetical protein
VIVYQLTGTLQEDLGPMKASGQRLDLPGALHLAVDDGQLAFVAGLLGRTDVPPTDDEPREPREVT